MNGRSVLRQGLTLPLFPETLINLEGFGNSGVIGPGFEEIDDSRADVPVAYLEMRLVGDLIQDYLTCQYIGSRCKWATAMITTGRF